METTLNMTMIRKSLEAQRIELMRRIMKQAGKKSSPHPENSSDRSLMAYRYISRQSNTNNLARAQELLQQVEGALERLDAGTYGSCQNCRLAIQPDRLRALPYSALCLECKEATENSFATPS